MGEITSSSITFSKKKRKKHPLPLASAATYKANRGGITSITIKKKLNSCPKLARKSAQLLAFL